MGRYAENTSVSTEKSRAEIERTISRYGADEFLYGQSDGEAMLLFRIHGRQVRFLLQLPLRKDYEKTPGRGLERSARQAEAAWEQACRQRWRALALAVKAKLEAVEAGISTFEQEFLANILLPDRRTVGQWLIPQLDAASAKMPPLLPDFGGRP